MSPAERAWGTALSTQGGTPIQGAGVHVRRPCKYSLESLRGRERVFLQKIEKALKKLDEGEFGVCEDCEEPISVKRLEARPETELCIRCKEDQERMERDFA